MTSRFSMTCPHCGNEWQSIASSRSTRCANCGLNVYVPVGLRGGAGAERDSPIPTMSPAEAMRRRRRASGATALKMPPPPTAPPVRPSSVLPTRSWKVRLECSHNRTIDSPTIHDAWSQPWECPTCHQSVRISMQL
jgi:DNA-directed RNA polymerase subunit RPC12/RpoP